MARALALQPAFKVSEPEEVVDRALEREGLLRRPAKRAEALGEGRSEPYGASVRPRAA